MSANFWINLFLAMFIFVCAIAYINRSKIRMIRTLLAQRLRRKILPKLEAVLPMIINARVNQADFFPMFRLRADLEALCLKADVLFDVEHQVLSEFLAKLSSAMPALESGLTGDVDIDDLVLSGQRVINELKEFTQK